MVSDFDVLMKRSKKELIGFIFEQCQKIRKLKMTNFFLRSVIVSESPGVDVSDIPEEHEPRPDVPIDPNLQGSIKKNQSEICYIE